MKETRVVASALGLGIVLICAGATYGAAAILRSLGVESIFTTIKISDPMKIFISLYLTGAVASLGLAALALFMISKARMKYGGWLGVLASASAIGTVLSAPVFGVAIDPVSALAVSAGGLLGVVGGVLAIRVPSVVVKAPFLTTLQIANSAVLSALTAILTGIAFVPSPTGGYTHIGDTIIFVASLLFGSKVGAITGVIGPVAADLWVGYPRWFVSIPAHGLEGLIAGLGRRRSIPIQVALCAVGGFVMASVYFYVNIFIKGWALAILSYTRDLIGQAGASIILAVILTRTVQRLLPRLKG
jgi:uncharacterized membrane protein